MKQARQGAASGIGVSNRDGKRIAKIEKGGGWLLVTTYGFADAAEVAQLTHALDGAMIASGCRHLIMDAREHVQGPREVSEAMWDWVCESTRLQAMALVNESENLALAVRMKSLASATRKVRPFSDLAEAQTWMRSALKD